VLRDEGGSTLVEVEEGGWVVGRGKEVIVKGGGQACCLSVRVRTRRASKLIFEECEVAEAGLKSGRRRSYIEAMQSVNDIAESLLVSEDRRCLLVLEGSSSRFETLLMHGGDSL
jgi:hypothetical protein